MSALTTSRLARGSAVVIVAAGTIAGAVGLSAAAPASKTHTLKLVTIQIADQQIGKYDVAADKDLQNGKVAGYDSTSCLIDFHTHVAKCAISVSRAGGTFRGKATLNLDNGTGTGTVTGGTGVFHGVTGTMTARSISQTKTAVTVRYHS